MPTEPVVSLELDGEIFQRIAHVVPPAAATEEGHFASMVLMRINTKGESTVTFVATNAYRLHVVTLFEGVGEWTIPEVAKGGIPEYIDVPIPAVWLAQQTGHKEMTTLTCEFRDKTWYLSMASASDVQQTSHDVTAPWLLNVAKTFKDPDEIADEKVTIDLDFLDLAIASAKMWAPPVLDGAINMPHPLAIHRLQPKGVSKFSIRNDVGLFEIGIMPMILEDEDDDIGFFEDEVDDQ